MKSFLYVDDNTITDGYIKDDIAVIDTTETSTRMINELSKYAKKVYAYDISGVTIMDDNTSKVQPINPIFKMYNNQRDNAQDERPQQQQERDVYEHVEYNEPVTLYNERGQFYASKHTSFRQYLEKELDKLFANSKLKDNLKTADSNNSNTNNSNSSIANYNIISNDVRTVLPIAPVYNSPQSYSGYVNQDPRNEMYQYLVNNKPRRLIHTTEDYQQKYFEEDGYTFKHDI